MIYTYANMYIAFVAPVIGVRDRHLVWVYKIAFWSGSDLENRAIHIHQEFLGLFIT